MLCEDGTVFFTGAAKRGEDGEGVDKEGAGEDEENSADGGDDDRPVGNGEVSGKHARFNDGLMMIVKFFSNKAILLTQKVHQPR